MSANASDPIVEVRRLVKHFPLGGGLFGRDRRAVQAVNDVSFAIARGETLSLVGESGCGKSTVGKCLTRLIPPTSGEILLAGQRIDDLSHTELKPLRRRFNIVFQDPYSSLNPRMNVGELIGEPLRSHGLGGGRAGRDARVADLLDRVGLPRDSMKRLPHQFSGGQRQRIGIARALASEPELIVCDEAVSALDVSVQAQIINLLADLQAELGLAMLFISHDLAVVEHLSDRVAVMYLGRIVELAERRALFARPAHPYSQALMSAVPVPMPAARDRATETILKGEMPSPVDPPSGCHFRTRCPMAAERCAIETPTLRSVGEGHWAACHFVSAASTPSAFSTGALP